MFEEEKLASNWNMLVCKIFEDVKKMGEKI